MTDEEKKAAETAKAEADKAEKEKADAFEASLEGLSDEEKEAKKVEKAEKDEPSKIDYEAEYQKEKEGRERAEKSAADAAFKLREERRKREEGGEPVPEGTGITEERLQEILAEERQVTQREFQATESSRLIKSKTTSDSEANLAEEVYKGMTFPSHYTLDDKVESVIAVVNRKKMIGERNELMRALQGKEGVVTDASGTHRDAQPGNEPKLYHLKYSEMEKSYLCTLPRPN